MSQSVRNYLQQLTFIRIGHRHFQRAPETGAKAKVATINTRKTKQLIAGIPPI